MPLESRTSLNGKAGAAPDRNTTSAREKGDEEKRTALHTLSGHRASVHRPLYECGASRNHADEGISFRGAVRDEVDVHNDRPRLPLPRRQDSRRNGTRSSLLDRKPGQVRKCFSGLGNARLTFSSTTGRCVK